MSEPNDWPDEVTCAEHRYEHDRDLGCPYCRDHAAIVAEAAKLPERIWLQIEDDGEVIPEDCEGRTWCQDQINKSDVEYVRADTLPSRTAPSPQEGNALLGDLATAIRDAGDPSTPVNLRMEARYFFDEAAAALAVMRAHGWTPAKAEPAVRQHPTAHPEGIEAAVAAEYRSAIDEGEHACDAHARSMLRLHELLRQHPTAHPEGPNAGCLPPNSVV